MKSNLYLFYGSSALVVLCFVLADVFFAFDKPLTYWPLVIMGVTYLPMVWFTWRYRRRVQILEEFDGFVNNIEDGTAFITLKKGDEVFYGEYDAVEFEKCGIKERRRFICRTVSYDDDVRIEFESIDDIVVSDEEFNKIKQRVSFLCDDGDLDGDY